jgi:uncharacterized membrane protein
MENIYLRFRSAMYALRGGFLIRPFAIALLLGAAGAILSSLEETVPAIGAWVPSILFPSRDDPQVAQVILSDVATSIMTVVSIVFAILLMTLTLASTQFSPRILVSFVRDRTTQWTLGVFLGTFSYCMAALPAARSLPHPFTPVVTTSGAMLLALASVGWLIYFIYHISQSINVNHIVDRIARETELVIDELMPNPRLSSPPSQLAHIDGAADGVALLNQRSGYIRFIDINRLLHLAKTYHVRIWVERSVGHFMPAGIPLLRASPIERINAERQTHLLATFDIGPTRTMQQDVEFGVIQIVDIALRAMSPAINDPSTAISCIDQLSRILIRWVGRAPPALHLFGPPHVLRLVVPSISLEGLLDTAFEQIRHYGAGDMAVSLRLLRAYGDIAFVAQDEDIHRALRDRAGKVVTGCKAHLAEDALSRLQQRLASLEFLPQQTG